MANWTKEAALTELSVLIAEIDSLVDQERRSAAHTRWLLRTGAFLDDVFGPTSMYAEGIWSLPWMETGSMTATYHGGTDPFYLHHQRAYRQQLETARGVLQAAEHELTLKPIESVYSAKDPALEAGLFLNVIRLAEDKLRKTIRSQPSAERTVQDAFENLLIGADIAYSREADAIEYSSKTYTPDFTLLRIELAVELKLCPRAEREKEIIAEINDDILAYKTKYRNLLFIVYDLGIIRDTQRFSQHFEMQEGVLVRVVKH